MVYSKIIFTDNYCVVCGNPLGYRVPSDEDNHQVSLDSYLVQVTAVSKDGHVVHKCVYNVLDKQFEKNGYRHRSVFDELGDLAIDDDDDQSLLLHTDCCKFVKMHLHINLNIRNIPIQNNRVAIDYGAMEKYQCAPFDLDRILSSNNAWILKSPSKIGLHHSKNHQRLQSIAAQFITSNTYVD